MAIERWPFLYTIGIICVMEKEINISTIAWQGPEYSHKKKSVDFLWTIGVVALVAAVIAIWRADRKSVV